MVDPKRVTDYNRSLRDLEEFAIFSICVAGKNAHNTSVSVDWMLTKLESYYSDKSPLDNIYQFVFDVGLKGLQALMKEAGIGCHTGTAKMPGRAEVCYELAKMVIECNLDLRTCSPAQLETIKGIGAKTSRFFIVHSRPNVRMAALDVHILKWLNDNNVKAPRTTPPKGSKLYARLEETFLQMCEAAGKGYAEMDLEIWNKYSLDGLENRGKVLVNRSNNEQAKHEAASTQSESGID